MQIKSITNGLAMASLTPDDCRLLAQACEEALVNKIGDQQGNEIIHTETLGAALKAAAIAMYCQVEMHASDLTLVGQRLKAIGW
jgi:hypothetical protein